MKLFKKKTPRAAPELYQAARETDAVFTLPNDTSPFEKELFDRLRYPGDASRIMAMEQLSDSKISADGKLLLPFGSELIKTSAMGENTLIGIDKNFALEFITNSGLVMETDKLIDRQLDQIAVSITCGFRKITPEAVKKIVIS